jgi:hypothetical protein
MWRLIVEKLVEENTLEWVIEGEAGQNKMNRCGRREEEQMKSWMGRLEKEWKRDEDGKGIGEECKETGWKLEGGSSGWGGGGSGGGGSKVEK